MNKIVHYLNDLIHLHIFKVNFDHYPKEELYAILTDLIAK